MKRALLIFAALSAWLSADAHAQTRFGGQLNAATSAGFGLGGRAEQELGEFYPLLFGIATAELFFPGDGSYYEVNGNLARPFALPEPSRFRPYAGAGLNLARANAEFLREAGDADATGPETLFGLNLLAGTRIVDLPEATARGVTPFGELRFQLRANSLFLVSVGLLF